MDDIDDILKEWKSDSAEAEDSGFAETGMDPLEAIVDDAWTEQGTSLTHIEEGKRKKRQSTSAKLNENFAEEALDGLAPEKHSGVRNNDGADSEIWGDLSEVTEAKEVTTERTLEETDWGDGGASAKVPDSAPVQAADDFEDLLSETVSSASGHNVEEWPAEVESEKNPLQEASAEIHAAENEWGATIESPSSSDDTPKNTPLDVATTTSDFDSEFASHAESQDEESWSALASDEDTWGTENGAKEAKSESWASDSDVFGDVAPEESGADLVQKSGSDPWDEKSEPEPKKEDDSWGASGDKAPSLEDSWGASPQVSELENKKNDDLGWGEDTVVPKEPEPVKKIDEPKTKKAAVSGGESDDAETKPGNAQIWEDLSQESASAPTQLDAVLDALNNDPELNVAEDPYKKKKKIVAGPSFKDKICALPGLFLTLLIRIVSWPLSYLEAPLRPLLITKTGLTWYDWAGGFIMVQTIFVLVQCFFILII